jgi:hypothetical protein
MPGFKQKALAATATALLCMPATQAVAAGPLLFAPWVLGGQVLGAVARLATLPLVIASAALSVPPPGVDYSPAGNYAPPTYYPRTPAYYGAPQAYYAPSLSYAYPTPRFYGQPRGYYAPVPRYSGYYGAQASYRSRGYSYRRR